MNISPDQVMEIKASNPLSAVVASYVELTAKGGEFHGPCPLICGTGQDRFIIFSDNKNYWCRQCDSKGDVLNFIMQKENLSFPEALRFLKKSDINPNKKALVPTVSEPTPDAFDDISQNERQELVASFQNELFNGAGDGAKLYHPDESLEPLRALSYLYGMRLLLPHTIERFALGFNAEPLDIAGRTMPPGIIIPLMNGNIITGFKVRTYPLFGEDGELLPDDQQYPKYWRIGRGSYTLNRNSMKHHKETFVTEGEFDAMLLHQFFGHRYGVVTFGGIHDANKANLAALFMNQEKVYWCYDGDDAGRKAASKMDGKNKRYQLIHLPEGHDITSFALANRTENFMNYFEYQMLGVAA